MRLAKRAAERRALWDSLTGDEDDDDLDGDDLLTGDDEDDDVLTWDEVRTWDEEDELS
jgi:hypothetical protein